MKKLLILVPLFCCLALAQTTIGGNSFPLIVSGPPAGCFIGVPYTFLATANGGVTPYLWSLVNGTVLPAGLSLNATTGLISGTCTTPGGTTFQLQVADSVGNFSSQPFTIRVTNPLIINPGSLPMGTVGTAYTTSPLPTAVGGTAPYAWSCPGCVYPAGLGPINTSTGVITGTPTAAGVYPLTLVVTDAAAVITTQPNSITINSGISITSGAPPGSGTVGTLFPTFTFTATGGTLCAGHYNWSVTSGAVPAGTTLNPTSGVLSGTPTTAATYTPTIQAQDCTAPTPNTASAGPFTIVISGSLPPALVATNSPCPSGVVGVPYTCTLTASGGTPGYVWTLLSGTNPAGTNLVSSSSIGTVSGTPTTVASYVPVYLVTDSVSATAKAPATGTYSITIAPASGCGPPNYACTSTSGAVIQAPTAPFSTTVGMNQIKYDTSINAGGSGLTGIDPTMRATDSTTGGTGFTVDISGGSGDNIFASDDSKIALIPQNSGGICVMGFTASTMQTANPCTTIPNTHSMSWFHNNPNIMVGLSASSPKVYESTFSSPTAFTQAVLIDPVSSTGPCGGFISGTLSGGSISVSADDNIIYGALVTNQQNSVGFVFAYNISGNQCTALNTNTGQVRLYNGTITASTMPCVPIGLHNSNLLQNGTYARMTTGSIGACTNKPQYWQINTTNVFTCSAEPQGHNSNGWNLEVIISNPVFFFGNVTSASYCTNINAQTYGNALGREPGDVENHFGINHVSSSETEPIIVGTAYVNNPGTTWTSPTINELWAFQRSPFKIQRFTHTFNSSQTLCPTCDFRDTEVIVTQSQTGKFAAWCSDMKLGLGNNTLNPTSPRIDVFITRLD